MTKPATASGSPILLVLLVDTRLQRDKPRVVLVERRIDRAGLRYELVDLERQNRVALPCILKPLVNGADPMEEIGQMLTAACFGLA